jgi:rhodanese-related sulfurtransferase
LLLQQVRNRREFALGRFRGAIDPRTRSFAEFPAWCSAQSELLRDKKVLMYCTGGVRCEKASAFIRATGVAKEVHHLRGGIHRYTETFGEDESLWMGTNFVFDRRAALEGLAPHAVSELAAPHDLQPKHIVVGRCVGCDAPWELMDGAAVCTVCNEPVLACDDCRALRDEHHCDEHSHLRHCFFRQLCPFSEPQLASQLAALTEKRRDKRLSRPARRTIGLHAQRVEQRLCSLQAGEAIPHAVLAEPTVEASVTLWVDGRFPSCKPEARLAWPCRLWPLSARPWAFIREVNCAALADAPRFGVEVDCKISADQYDTELGLRLAPHGRHARTRIWSVRWDGPRNATLVACALQQAVSADVAEQDSQRKLHLRWLGFELLGSNPPELDRTPGNHNGCQQ